MENIINSVKDETDIKSNINNFVNIKEQLKKNNKRIRNLNIINKDLEDKIIGIMKKYDLDNINYNSYIFSIKNKEKKESINKNYMLEKLTKFTHGNTEYAKLLVDEIYDKKNRFDKKEMKIVNKVKKITKNDLM